MRSAGSVALAVLLCLSGAVRVRAGSTENRALFQAITRGVRAAAAMALTTLTFPEALGGLRAALQADYGAVDGRSRNPEMHAHIVRLVALRFPSDPRTAELIAAAAGRPEGSV